VTRRAPRGWLQAAALLAAALLAACSPQAPDNAEGEASGVSPYDPRRDYFSFANTDQFRSRHLELDLTVDFERGRLQGSVVHHMERLDPDANTIVLDSRGLEVQGALLTLPNGQSLPLGARPGGADPVRGEPLEIRLPEGLGLGGEFRLKIDYRTGAEASAIMWLPPQLTAGGRHPFMFTQSQSIHARSWIPLQDSPAVRTTYEATIRVPQGLVAVMSADNDPQAPRDGEYRFLMPQPIPSYLMALAVGNLEFAPFGEDTGVYAEPEVLPAAAWEFADTQAMLDAAEAIYGAYQWGRYDLLILPPGFPYGGMENPRLSFITPSVLAGDRSLVSLIAHELAHSWSGNLVSNRTWRDIWLNEGTTSYLEARLMETLFGPDRADEERVLAYQSLLRYLETVPAEMQPLAPVFAEGDPDEGQQGLEYAKGQMLLEYLEARFGRRVFDEFLEAYFGHFAFQAIGSDEFLDYLDHHLLQRHPGIVSRGEVETWLYGPGLPPAHTVPASASLEQAAAMAAAWSAGELQTTDLPAGAWSPQATVRFVDSLAPGLGDEMLAELDATLALSDSGNAEIARAWFTQVAQRQFRPAYVKMQAFLSRSGRIYLIRPVYQALVANGRDAQLAAQLFEQARSNYHPLTTAAIETLFQ
jgi:aminopeptidase N